MRSIRVKMVVMYIILVLIVMAAVGTFTVFRLRQNEEDTVRESLENTADRIIDEVILRHFEHEFNTQLFINFRADEVASIFEYYILDGFGRVLASNVWENIWEAERHQGSLNTQAVIEVLEGEDSVFIAGRSFNNYQGRLVRGMQYARKFNHNGIGYVVYLRMDAEVIYEGLNDIMGIFLLGLLMAFVIAAVLGVIFAGSVNRPIRVLTRKAADFAKGALDEVLVVHSNDEIGQLTESFNNMASELKQTLAGLENEKNQNETVLNNVTDGVLAYDTGGRLIHANHVSRELLGIANIERVSFRQMLSYLGINDEQISKKEITEMVLDINERYINVVINHYKTGISAKKGVTAEGGVVMILQDMTKHILLDNMRKEFVANVSHELRTPLTTIKSYSETLLEEFLEKEKNSDSHNIDFLRTIESETDRMTLLVNDLLELSRFDNKQLEFNFQVFDLAELLRSNVTKHRNTLEMSQSKKEITFTPPGIEMPVYADYERINQVVSNIITNSLRYSGNEALVEVEAVDHEGYYIIRIMDNGVGIPPEDLERIFERFYRVDKARSRELGGTGLGLSISKDIVEAHGGTLTARSRLGMGTCMIITLERAKREADEEDSSLGSE